MFANRRESETLLLRVVRFRKLLEGARELVDVIQDTREKLAGEYIFDRQYILTQIAKVVELTERLVFDAYVLEPQDSQNLFAIWDEGKRLAQQRFMNIPDKKQYKSNPAAVAQDDMQDLEYRMLNDVIHWMEGPSETGITMFDVLRKVVDHVINGSGMSSYTTKKGVLLEMAYQGVQNRIDMVNLDSTETDVDVASIKQLHCRPLAIMTAAVTDQKRKEKSNPNTSSHAWFAASTDDSLSLYLTETNVSILLEASLMGHMASDFIFLYAKGCPNCQELLPTDFRVEKTEQGFMSWLYDVPTREIEQNLFNLARNLFGRASFN